ncbi:hypothetical protein DICSQDRAFT_183205 [Dichomitus squalens LYAD-421 SS1]|uniref:Uncharacterized protein n=1 Tax=Dichomitus squalens (strain LYAD-421) TaxID=732165 RepID=R7SMY3_DICSQ|nr:uncharacterized protein DICSQDRAFT_183205 [Dichomitus squalens LYAD-421 SS1]EJF57491.1 hypothetical protein DICSQDRAFT_183205 [Dichomitus squalens LYAD-421 SS1]
MHTAALLLLVLFGLFHTVSSVVPFKIVVAPIPSPDPITIMPSHMESAIQYIHSAYSAICDFFLDLLSCSPAQLVRMAPYLVDVLPALAYITIVLLFTNRTAHSDLDTAPAPRPLSRCSARFSDALSWLTGGLLVSKAHHDRTIARCLAKIDFLQATQRDNEQELSWLRERFDWQHGLEVQYLSTIAARNASIARRNTRIERLVARLDEAQAAIAEREAAIVDKDLAIAEATAIIREKDAAASRLVKDAELFRSNVGDTESTIQSLNHCLSEDTVHITQLIERLHHAQSVGDQRKATIHALEAEVQTSRAEADARIAAADKAHRAKEDALQRDRQEFLVYRMAIIAQKDTLVAGLQTDVLQLQRDLDASLSAIAERDDLIASLRTDVSRLQGDRARVQADVDWGLRSTVEKDALAASRAVDDLRSEREAFTHSASVQAQLKAKLEASEKRESDEWFADTHLPPASETSHAADQLESLTQELADAKQEIRKITRLQQAYEEAADAGAVRVLGLLKEMEELKELAEVDHELLIARIKKLTIQLDKARSGVPDTPKPFVQLRLPNLVNHNNADSFTAVTPRLPSSEFLVEKPYSHRSLRRIPAAANLRRPFADITASTINASNGGSMRMNLLPQEATTSMRHSPSQSQ